MATKKPLVIGSNSREQELIDTDGVDFSSNDHLAIPSSAGGTTIDGAGEVCVDTTSKTLNYFNGTAETVLDPQLSKTMVIETPTATEDISFFYVEDAITITKLTAVCVGTTPSVTFTIKHGTDRSAAGAALITAPSATTNTTTGVDVTTFDDATVVADSFIWLETTATSGTVTNIQITVLYTIDA